jgi:hypothetical protein
MPYSIIILAGKFDARDLITKISHHIVVRRRTQSVSGLINLEGISFDNCLIVSNSNVIQIAIISLYGAIRFFI